MNKKPISIYFLWHSKTKYEETILKSFTKFFSDETKPFSRSLNIPVYFRTDVNKKIKDIDLKLSERNIIFIFIDENIIVDQNKIWIEYIKDLYSKITDVNNKILPIALNTTAFNIDSLPINELNFIRYFDFSEDEKEHLLFIYMSNEIIKLFNNNSAVNLFLSHTKYDNNAVQLTKNIKNYIDNSTLKRFFDAFDISPGKPFSDEINNKLSKDTIISIHSDSYSSRPWCQKEIILAKKHDRPIIIVDFLEKFEDRIFPLLSNSPAVHILPDEINNNVVISLIIEIAMLETLRYTYCKYYLKYLQNLKLLPVKDSVILSRPPELYDLSRKEKNFLYPDPPIQIDENELFLNIKQLNKKCITPLTYQHGMLIGLDIGLSVSEPEKNEILEKGFDYQHINIFLSELTRNLLYRNASLSYGGDLRKNGYTEFLFELAGLQKDQLKENFNKIKNYQAWPIYLNNEILWIAEHKTIADFISIEPPDDVRSRIKDINTFINPDTLENRYIWVRSLTKMRQSMIKDVDIRICTGGRSTGYKSIIPGVLEEILISLMNNKPFYLIGCFGGMTSAVIELVESNKIPDELTLDWQDKNNNDYKNLVDFYNNEKSKSEINIDYDNICKTIKEYGIKNISKNNGLTEDENIILFNSIDFYEIIALIIKGLGIILGKKR